MEKVFNYIKADKLFKDYLPFVHSYKHKIRGKNGRGNPTEFSTGEKTEIKKALLKLFKELDSSIK
jgi:hypothetical protein